MSGTDVVTMPAGVSSPAQAVSASFPPVPGLQRRIVELWTGKDTVYFRVNFHDPDKNNHIVRSHFVAVQLGEARQAVEEALAPKASAVP